MLEAVRIGVAGILLLLGGLMTLANGYYFWLGIRHPGERTPSLGPLIGGIAGVAGLSLAPIGSFSDRLPYLWIPFVLDLGSGMYFGMFVAGMVGEIVRKDGG